MSLAHSFSESTLSALALTVTTNNSQAKELKPLPIKNEVAVLKAAHWLNQSSLVSKLSYHITPASENGISNVGLKFQLADNVASNFILLKGLFDFGNASAFAVKADKDAQTFELTIKTTDDARTISVLETIFSWLEKEINFKARLKQVIQFEQRIREEQTRIYSGLNSIFA